MKLYAAYGGILCLLAGMASALPLDLDASYGTRGRVTFSTEWPVGDGSPPTAIGRSVVQADGKLVVSGRRTIQIYPAHNRNEQFLRRFNADGTLDFSFGISGEMRFSLRGSDTIDQITLQPDGKIVLAVAAIEPCTPVRLGYCINDVGQNTIWSTAFVRVTTDGALDPTWGTNGVAETFDFYGGEAVAVQPNGMVLLLGQSYGVGPNWKLLRFDGNGVRDQTFNGGQPVSSRCEAYAGSILLQPDGRILVGGDDGTTEPNRGLCIERLFADGSPDPAFNPGLVWTPFGIKNFSLMSLVWLPDGNVLAVGAGQQYIPGFPPNTVTWNGVIGARFNSTGILDSTYGNGGIWFVPNFRLRNFTFAQDGGIVAAGYGKDAQQYRLELLKVTIDGHVDGTFGDNGFLVTASDQRSNFLRDTEDRWLLVSTTTLPDLNIGGVIERFMGERPDSVPVVEFYNFTLKHYFLTATASEAAGIDAGVAGPGWERTGETFRAWRPASVGSLAGVPQLSQPLCRFYGTPGRGPNSHFYTISVLECDLVRQDPGWTFESLAFYAFAPLTGPAGNSCPDGMLPAYRVYNNRFAENDSNHRYTTNAVTYQQMQQLGWTGEGIVFCAASQ